MLIAIYILSFFLLLDCLFLGLLILMQLPKKEAGLGGAAFGGGAVDALIGAGAGNVLTKATKYSAIAFFVLIVSLSLLHSRNARRNVTDVSNQIEAQQAAAPATATAPNIQLPPLQVSTAAAPAAATSAPAAEPAAPTQTPE